MREAVVVDSTLHKAFTITYAIYVVTAVLAAFSLPPSLQAVGGGDLTRFWFVGLGITGLFSLVFSLAETRQRMEMISTSLLTAFLTLYSVAVIGNGATKGNLDLIMVGVFTLSFAVMPLWRVQFFFRKFRDPRG